MVREGVTIESKLVRHDSRHRRLLAVLWGREEARALIDRSAMSNIKAAGQRDGEGLVDTEFEVKGYDKLDYACCEMSLVCHEDLRLDLEEYVQRRD